MWLGCAQPWRAVGFYHGLTRLNISGLSINSSLLKCSTYCSNMDTIFDTPAVDLLDYGNDDGPVYYWMDEDETLEDELAPTPAYF